MVTCCIYVATPVIDISLCGFSNAFFNAGMRRRLLVAGMLVDAAGDRGQRSVCYVSAGGLVGEYGGICTESGVAAY